MALDKTFDAAAAEKRLYAAWEKAGPSRPAQTPAGMRPFPS